MGSNIIVRVQRPLNKPNLSGMLLVYDEDRSHEFMIPVDSGAGRELLKIMGEHKKMYCRFRVPEQVENYNQWKYQGRVRDQRW